MGDDRAVHGARAERPVGVGVEVDQHPFHAAAQVEQRGAPGAPVLRRGRRIDLDQPVRQVDRAQRDPGIAVFQINILSKFLHNYSCK